jgi:UDP-N-acetylglucosamine:LPS N-acetylglucosamine transferase
VRGTGVGTGLLDKVVPCPPAASAIPGLRMIAVTGPRIDPRTIDPQPGLEIHGYLPHLYRWLAAFDLVVIQGGLTTCMELSANRRPFLYSPRAPPRSDLPRWPPHEPARRGVHRPQ